MQMDDLHHVRGSWKGGRCSSEPGLIPLCGLIWQRFDKTTLYPLRTSMGKKNSQAKEKTPAEAPEPAEPAVPAPEPKLPIQVVYCSGALDMSTQIILHHRWISWLAQSALSPSNTANLDRVLQSVRNGWMERIQTCMTSITRRVSRI